MKNKYMKLLSVFIIIFCVGIMIVLVKAYFDGEFDSVETLQAYIKRFGLFGPVVLTVIQAAQVVVPILPGFLGCSVGAVMFGCWGGFICNYIGISIGSVAAFFLARKFGMRLVGSIFPESKFEKWSARAGNSKSFTAFLFAAMVLPLFPDDFFCYFTGLTQMKVQKFIWIIILGKPWCILAYSIAFSLIK